MVDVLLTFPPTFRAPERLRAVAEPAWAATQTIPVSGASGFNRALLDDLIATAMRLFFSDDDDDAPAPTAVDQWLAPRLHWAMRITRRQASDRNLWFWLATEYPEFVQARWGSEAEPGRWHGPVNKQTFARLWWTAELYRAPGNYEPVGRALDRQRLVDLLLPRTIVRTRTVALALIDFIAPPVHVPDSAPNQTHEQRDRLVESQVDDLARIMNLVTAGTSPEVEAASTPDDYPAYRAWTQAEIPPTNWAELPEAPRDFEITPAALAAAEALVQRCWGYVTAQERSSR